MKEEVSDVFLMAAGLGTRLRPITDKIPKPLVEVGGKALIDRHLLRCQEQGFKRVMINLHYLPEKIKDHIQDGSRYGLNISYSFEPQLLNTGGGIKNIEDWIQTPELMVINSDSLFDSTLNLKELLRVHRKNEGKMTLLVRKCGLEGGEDKDFTKLWVQNSRLKRFGNGNPGECSPVNYLGVMVLSTSLFDGFPSKGTPFSITSDVIPRLLAGNGLIEVVQFDGFWSDIGTTDRFEAASKLFNQAKSAD